MNHQQANGWNGTMYILFPALLFTVAYELVSAVLSAFLSWFIANGNSAWKAGVLNHPGDVSAVCSAIAAAVGFLTVWKIARSEIAYTKPLDFSYAFPNKDREASRAGNSPCGAGIENHGNPEGNLSNETKTRVWRKLLSAGKRPANLTLIAAAGGILLSLFLNAALTAAGAVQADAGTAAASRQTAAVSLPLGILVYGILTPFCEESVFRGITLPRCCRAFLPGAASEKERDPASYKRLHRAILAGILISSILFGLYHENLVQGFYAFCMGMIFCLFYFLSGNLLLVTALHGAVNVVTMISSQTGFYSILVLSPAWMAAVAAGAIVCGGYVWFRLKKSDVLED